MDTKVRMVENPATDLLNNGKPSAPATPRTR